MSRRENLRKLIDELDGVTVLSKKLGYKNASFLVQMAGPNPIQEISEKTARRIESKLGLVVGWLDRSAPAVPKRNGEDETLDVLRELGKAADRLGAVLSASKMADLVAFVSTYSGPSDREQFISELIELLR